MQVIQDLFQKLIFFVNNFSVAPTYIKAGAIIVLLFLLVNGSTAITALLGWKNAPKPIKTALDIGKANLIKTIICTP